MPDNLQIWATIITAIVAVVALMQPWLLAAWKKWVKPGKVDIYETGTIELSYGILGTSIGLWGTLRAVDRDFFISSMQVLLKFEEDKEEHNFEWGVFRSPSVLLDPQKEMPVEVPSGFMLSTAQPHKYSIQFHDTVIQQKIQAIAEKVRTAWREVLKKAEEDPKVSQGLNDPALKDETKREIYKQFSKSSEHVSAFSTLDRLCYWKPGRYNISLSVETARPKKVFTKSWAFELSEDETKRLRFNALKVVDDNCEQYSWTHNFVFARYLYPKEQTKSD